MAAAGRAAEGSEEREAAGPAGGEEGSASPELKRQKRLVCVEYPGVVKDVDKALLTLGGEEGVSRVRPPLGKTLASGSLLKP